MPISLLIIMDAEEVKEETLSSEEELGETWKPDFFFHSSWQLTSYVNLKMAAPRQVKAPAV